jgi:hypothetical protein
MQQDSNHGRKYIDRQHRKSIISQWLATASRGATARPWERTITRKTIYGHAITLNGNARVGWGGVGTKKLKTNIFGCGGGGSPPTYIWGDLGGPASPPSTIPDLGFPRFPSGKQKDWDWRLLDFNFKK